MFYATVPDSPHTFNKQRLRRNNSDLLHDNRKSGLFLRRVWNEELELVFPIQYIFEDFIAEYIRKRFDDILKLEPQKSDLYLHTNLDTFNLQHDILLIKKKTGEQIIVDTKYKSRWNHEKAIQRKG